MSAIVYLLNPHAIYKSIKLWTFDIGDLWRLTDLCTARWWLLYTKGNYTEWDLHEGTRQRLIDSTTQLQEIAWVTRLLSGYHYEWEWRWNTRSDSFPAQTKIFRWTYNRFDELTGLQIQGKIITQENTYA